MDITELYRNTLEEEIKRLNLKEEAIYAADCGNCGNEINYYATKRDNIVKLQACYWCGLGSIQVIN